MITSLTLADKDGVDVKLHDQANGRACYSISGLIGTPTVRDNKRVRPQKRGGINPDRFTDGALMAASLEAFSSASVTAAIATARDMIRPMRDTLTYGAAVLKWTEDTSGLALQRTVKLASDVDPTPDGAAAFLDFQAQFFAEDPRAFSQTRTTYTGAALSTVGGGRVEPFTFPYTYATAGGGTLTVLNAGTDDTPPVWRIYGTCVNPQIVNLATHERIVLVGTIATPHYVEIDVQAGTVMLDGMTSLPNLVSSAPTTWFECPGVSSTNPTGATNVQLIADTFEATARLDGLTRAAY